MREERPTFDKVQSGRRRSSVFIFSLLVTFYFAAFALLWAAAKIFLLIWFARIHPWTFGSRDILVVFTAALLLAVGHWLEAVGKGVDRILSSLGTVPPDPKDRYHRSLVNVVEEMRLAAGLGDVKVAVMPTMGMNAFSVTDLKGRSCIGVSEGLISRMTRAQLQGVVAHEAAHIREGDNLVVTMACSLFGVFSQMLAGIESASEEEGRAFILYPIIWFISMGAYFLNMLVSRQREYLADATAVELTRDPVALAEALYKLSRRWRGGGIAREELAPIFIVNPAGGGLAESEGLLADLFSTHPPIRERIRILLGMAHAAFGEMAGRVNGEDRRGATGQGTAPRAPESAAASPLWIAYHDGDWRGPFSAEALLGQAWMAPLTWVAALGSKEIKPARDVPGLLEGFARRAGKPAAGNACPACRIPLREREYEGIMIRECPSCRGVLLSRGQDYRILLREEEVFTARIQRMAEDFARRNVLRPGRKRAAAEAGLAAAYRCPDCGRSMLRRFYNYQYFVEVDRCLECGLTWFDGDELELLQALVEKARKGLPD